MSHEGQWTYHFCTLYHFLPAGVNHAVACSSLSFIFIAKQYCVVRIYHHLAILSFLDIQVVSVGCGHVMNLLLHILGTHVDRFLQGTFLGVQLMGHQVFSKAKLPHSNCANYSPSCSVFAVPLFHTLVYMCYFQVFLFCLNGGGIMLLGFNSHFLIINEAEYIFILFVGYLDFPFRANSKLLDRAIGLSISFILIFRNSFR